MHRTQFVNTRNSQLKTRIRLILRLTRCGLRLTPYNNRPCSGCDSARMRALS